MNHEQFELLMADALGDDLSGEDRAAFETALAAHADWKQEYETAQRTLGCLAELGAPKRVVARREGDALIIEPRTTKTVAPQPVRGARRYAAAVLIAFTAGYALHATLVLQEGVRPTDTIVKTTSPESDDQHAVVARPTSGTFEAALVKTHARKPSRSTLAKCLIAVAAKR